MLGRLSPGHEKFLKTNAHVDQILSSITMVDSHLCLDWSNIALVGATESSHSIFDQRVPLCQQLDHRKALIGDCMAEEEYLKCWHEISQCDLPKTREEPANSEVPLWKEVQVKINLLTVLLPVHRRKKRSSILCDRQSQGAR